MVPVAIVLIAALGVIHPLPETSHLDLKGNIQVRAAAAFAKKLLENGTPQDIKVAEQALEVVLSSQERRPGAAHRGNFPWRSKDPVVEDLNSVEFTLSYLIPMMMQNGDRLSEAMRGRVRESIGLGLEEIRRMDVAVTYTNIATMDCLNSCLGGEFLHDRGIAKRGYRKFKRLADLTADNGTVFEFDSPNYMLVTMRALKLLAGNVQDNATRIRARTMAARLALGEALHIHPELGRLAGPHSRAYYPSVVCESDPEVNAIRNWIKDGAAPRWIASLLDTKPIPMQIRETAVADWSIGTTTYFSPSYALGVASREVSMQSDVFILQSLLPRGERPLVMYSRYLINDKWFENAQNETERSKGFGLFDQGKFFGVQSGPRAIGLYAPRTVENLASFAPYHAERIKSAKAVLVWSQYDQVDEIWVGGQKIDKLPATIQPGEVVVIAAGPTLVAVRPLTLTDLGYKSPIRIRKAGNNLVLEMYNYLGPEKAFNELDRFSRFYRGQPRCGFYVETAERSLYPDRKSFGETVARGSLTDKAEPPFTTYVDFPERLWTVEYKRDGHTLGIEIDLNQWKLKRRWTQEGELGWPMLQSPVARQNADGRVVVGDAALSCGKNPGWLYGNPAEKIWVAGYHGDPAPLTLTVPNGKVVIQAMGTGLVVWDKGNVSVEAIGLRGTPTIVGGNLKTPTRNN